jgi:hypothetical protein
MLRLCKIILNYLFKAVHSSNIKHVNMNLKVYVGQTGKY